MKMLLSALDSSPGAAPKPRKSVSIASWLGAALAEAELYGNARKVVTFWVCSRPSRSVTRSRSAGE